MTELKLLMEFHKDAERQGPGGQAETIRAFNLTEIQKTDRILIADIGCGTGAQTFTLAENTNSRITAVDIFPEFLERIESEAQKRQLVDRILTEEHSMENLPFQDQTFDLIWSEGAIYIMGFEKGIREWKRFLKPRGFLVVSEMSWFTDTRPEALNQYWQKECPTIDTISGKIRQLEKSGYCPVAHFLLPDYCWTRNYYDPILSRADAFIAKHGYSPEAMKLVEIEKEEIRIYQTYKDFFGYVFYIAQSRT